MPANCKLTTAMGHIDNTATPPAGGQPCGTGTITVNNFTVTEPGGETITGTWTLGFTAGTAQIVNEPVTENDPADTPTSNPATANGSVSAAPTNPTPPIVGICATGFDFAADVVITEDPSQP
ncbi:MAG TPA: hypothetical protein VIN56_03715 [Candidatus Dormibacteraeota bacterium]